MKRLFPALLMLSVARMGAQSPVTWSQTQIVAASHFGNMHPRVAIDGSGDPLLIWGNGNTFAVWFSRWDGTAFTTPVRLNPDSIPVFAASWAGPDLAAHGDTVYAVFKETPEDTNGIYLRRSFDGGVTFDPPVRVDAIADSISRFPAVGVNDAGEPLVAFMKFDPGWSNPRYVLTRSTDLGQTFEPDVPASGFSGGVVCDCCPATVTATGNSVAVLYRDNLDNLRNSWAGLSENGGASFTGGIAVDNTNWNINACPSSGPDGVFFGDSLFATFMSAAGGKTLCYRSRSNRNTQQLEDIQPLTGNFAGLGQQNYPRIAASGKSALIAWRQTVNNAAQLAALFTQDIENGFPNVYETVVTDNVANLDVAMGNGKVYLVWESSNDGTVKFKSGTFTPVSQTREPAGTPALKLYPIPAANATLQVEPVPAVARYDIYDANGRLVETGEIVSENSVATVQVWRLVSGFYRLAIYDGQAIQCAGFIRP